MSQICSTHHIPQLGTRVDDPRDLSTPITYQIHLARDRLVAGGVQSEMRYSILKPSSIADRPILLVQGTAKLLKRAANQPISQEFLIDTHESAHLATCFKPRTIEDIKENFR